jgi:hypothetical protein
METLLAGALFAILLIAEIAAVTALHGARRNRQSQARDAIERDREAKAILYSAP